MRVIFAFVVLLALAVEAGAWGPFAHEFLGQHGAELAGLEERDRVAVASGSLLADLDHTLESAGVVGDSAAFARAVVAAAACGPLSDRFAAGWLAHALAQDPGQQEIASRDAKLCADMILVRTAGFPSGGAICDVQRIRAAAAKLGATPPQAKDVTRAVEKLVLLALVETAALDMLPLDLDEPTGNLPPARELMPPELKFHERRLEGSMRATAEVIAGALARMAARLPAGQPHAARGGDVIGLPPAALLGITVRTRTVAGGLSLTTARLAHPLLFRTAIRVVVNKLGKRLFPTVAGQWDGGSRIKAVTRALEAHLERSAAELEALFPPASLVP